MAQVLEMVRTLQDNAAASKAEQERMQTELAASQSRNDELNRVNEELRRMARQPSPPRAFPMPFSPEIMGTMVPPKPGGGKSVVQGGRRPGGASDGIPHPDDVVWGLRRCLLQNVHEHIERNHHGVVCEFTRRAYHVFLSVFKALH